MVKTAFASIISMAGLGFFFASILAIVSNKLKVEEDPKIMLLEGTLPGSNCGVCGFTSCHQYAEALAKGAVEPDKCKTGGENARVGISSILGVQLEKKIKSIALVHCGQEESVRKKKAVYFGIKTCSAAHNTSGGELLCGYGCLGLSDCVKACPFDAIKMEKGLPRVIEDKCVACGKCALACPRNIISIDEIHGEDFIYVACNNTEKGADTSKACKVGCIACGICQKMTDGIFHVETNLAHVKYNDISMLQATDEVVVKCPTKCIVKL